MRLHNYTPPTPSSATLWERLNTAERVEAAWRLERLLGEFPGSARDPVIEALEQVDEPAEPVPTPDDLTDATARVIERLQADEHTGPLASAYQQVLEAAGRRMARSFRSQAVALTADSRFVPPDEDEVIASGRLADEVNELVGDAQREAARVVVAELDKEGISFDIDTVFTDDLLDRIAANAAFGIERDLRATYRTALEQAAVEGWSVADTAEALTEKIEDLAPHTARALARTELNGLANGGSVHVATQTVGPDRQLYKTWLATNDDRTRESHVEAHGQSVLVNERFIVDGAPLSYPGDPFGPPETVINCRCTVIYSSEPGGTAVTAGGSQPSEGLPLLAPTEEAPMSTTETQQLATNGDGDIEMLTPIAWDAVLCVEGETTEDGRLLERGSISWRDLPLTLMGMLKTGGWGHEGAEVAGRIDTISRVVDELASTGELTSEFGVNQMAPLIADRTVRGVSIDLAVLDWEYRDRDTGEVLSEDDLFIYWLEGRETDIVFTVLEGTIVGATVCPMPAIANAEITLAASAGLGQHARSLIASAIEGRNIGPDDVRLIKVFTPFDRPTSAQRLVAAAPLVELAAPPRSHFEVSEFPGKTPFTVTEPDETGWRRAFGHLATWDTCHVGIPGVCTTAPRSSTTPAYALFHQGQFETDDGLIDVGKMMLGTGHADLGASRMEATRHYDKPDMVGAYVRAVDGEHGIWVSGVVRSELTAAGIRELRANPPSGDWRSYNGRLELIAACAVAVPGFPVVADAKANITASGGEVAISALIASAGVIVPTSEVKAALVAAGCDCDDLVTDDEYVDDLAELGEE